MNCQKFGKFGIKSDKKEFDGETVYNKKYLRNKIKSYEEKISANVDGVKIPKEGFQCICLSVILTDSILRTGKIYYPKVHLEECKYVIKGKKMSKYITGDVEIAFDENSDEQNSDKENYSEE